MAFQFDLVAPERAMVSTEATLVTAPGVEGDFGVMEGHAPLLSTLRPGVVTATYADGSEHRFVVFGGLAEVGPEHCAILAEEVHLFDELEPHTLEQRIKDAEAELETGDHDSVHRRAQKLNDLRSLQMLHKA